MYTRMWIAAPTASSDISLLLATVTFLLPPLYVQRLGPQTLLIFVVFENVKGFFGVKNL